MNEGNAIRYSKPKTIKYIFVYFILFLAGDFFSSVPFDILFSFIKLPESWMYQLPRISGCLLFTSFLFWFYTTKVLKLNMSDFGINLSVKKWAVLYSVLLPAFVFVCFLAIGEFFVNEYSLSDSVIVVIISLLFALKAGILEELLFRGYIMKLLEGGWNRHIAILLPSFLFSVLHIPQMNILSVSGILLLIVSGTLVGIMFSLAAYKGGSVSNSILMHSVWNFVMITDILKISTVQDTYGSPIFSVIIPSDNILLTGAGFGVEASIIAVIGYFLICCLLLLKKR